MQSWGARLKAALSGEVDGGDLRALLAATSPLATLHQALDDRRLEAELAHTGQEWQAALDIGQVAGPLWLADAFVTLAGGLIDAEAEAHQDRSALMSALSHHHAQALLETVGPMLIAVSGTLADPSHAQSFSLPVVIGQRAASVDATVSYMPVPYIRGLLLGADRLEGAVTQVLDLTGTLVGRSPAPPWLSAGLQRLRGELAALDTRQEIIRAQGAALLAHQTGDAVALRQLAGDLWGSIDVLLRVGQLAAAPMLLPGAVYPSRARQAPAPISSVNRAPPAVVAVYPAAAQPSPPDVPPQPAPAVHPAAAQPSPPDVPPQPAPVYDDPARSLPEIAPAWHATGAPGAPSPSAPTTPMNSSARSLPEIGSPAQSPRAGDEPEAERRGERPRPMPQIGSAARADAERVQAKPTAHPRQDAPVETAPGNVSAAGRPVDRKNRWLLSSSAVRHRLRAAGGEEDAERDIAAFWDARAWTLSAASARYLDQVAALVTNGSVAASGRSFNSAPYAPIYRVNAPRVIVMGQSLSQGSLVAFDYQLERLVTPGPSAGVAD